MIEAKRGFNGLVRVKEIPAGEAPLEIRERWVGLILPCHPIAGFPNKGEREKGALSGKETTYKDGQPVPDGRVGLYNRCMVSVPQKESLRILALNCPWAANYWYRLGFPKPAPNDCFAFGENEVEIISGVKFQRVVRIPSDYH